MNREPTDAKTRKEESETELKKVAESVCGCLWERATEPCSERILRTTPLLPTSTVALFTYSWLFASCRHSLLMVFLVSLRSRFKPTFSNHYYQPTVLRTTASTHHHYYYCLCCYGWWKLCSETAMLYVRHLIQVSTQRCLMTTRCKQCGPAEPNICCWARCFYCRWSKAASPFRSRGQTKSAGTSVITLVVPCLDMTPEKGRKEGVAGRGGKHHWRLRGKEERTKRVN